MKIRRVVSLFCFLALSLPAYGHGNKPGQAKLEVDGGTVTIDYIAPALEGRDINVMIKQPGANPWRLGADAPTTLATPVDLQFGDAVLAAGKYTLRAYLDESGDWWLQAYDSSRNLAGKIALELSQSSEPKENMEIRLTGSNDSVKVAVQWGTQVLAGNFSVAD